MTTLHVDTIKSFYCELNNSLYEILKGGCILKTYNLNEEDEGANTVSLVGEKWCEGGYAANAEPAEIQEWINSNL